MHTRQRYHRRSLTRESLTRRRVKRVRAHLRHVDGLSLYIRRPPYISKLEFAPESHDFFRLTSMTDNMNLQLLLLSLFFFSPLYFWFVFFPTTNPISRCTSYKASSAINVQVLNILQLILVYLSMFYLILSIFNALR